VTIPTIAEDFVQTASLRVCDIGAKHQTSYLIVRQAYEM
jgi:hypothetical protein